jgi:hypothetical protein
MRSAKVTLCAALSCVAAAALFLRQPLLAQGEAAEHANNYSALLELIFPKRIDDAIDAIVLRVSPPFDPEMQVTVKRLITSTVSAEMATVSGRSAWDLLVDRSGSPRLNIRQLAGRVRVDRRSFLVDAATMDDWRTALFDALQSTGKELDGRVRHEQSTGELRVVSDATLYELWYKHEQLTFYWQFRDGELDPKLSSNLPLAQWMATVVSAARDKVGGRR